MNVTKEDLLGKPRKIVHLEDLDKARVGCSKYYTYNFKDLTFGRHLLNLAFLSDTIKGLIEAINVPSFKEPRQVASGILDMTARPIDNSGHSEGHHLDSVKALYYTEELLCEICNSSIVMTRHTPRTTVGGTITSKISSYEPQDLKSCSCGHLKLIVDHLGRPNVYSSDLTYVHLQYYLESSKGFIPVKTRLGTQPTVDIPSSSVVTNGSSQSPLQSPLQSPSQSLLDAPKVLEDHSSYNNYKLLPTSFLTTHGVSRAYEAILFPQFNTSGLTIPTTRSVLAPGYTKKEHKVDTIHKVHKANLKVSQGATHGIFYRVNYSRQFRVVISDFSGIYLPSGLHIKPHSPLYTHIKETLKLPENDYRVPRAQFNQLIDILESFNIPIGTPVMVKPKFYLHTFAPLNKIPRVFIGYLTLLPKLQSILMSRQTQNLWKPLGVYQGPFKDSEVPDSNFTALPPDVPYGTQRIMITYKGKTIVRSDIYRGLVRIKAFVSMLWYAMGDAPKTVQYTDDGYRICHSFTAATKVAKSLYNIEYGHLKFNNKKLRLPLSVLQWNKVINTEEYQRALVPYEKNYTPYAHINYPLEA